MHKKLDFIFLKPLMLGKKSLCPNTGSAIIINLESKFNSVILNILPVLPITIQALLHSHLLQTLMSGKSHSTQIQSLLEAFFPVTTFGYTEKNKHGFG
jgi:hypothetical protein